MDYQDPLRAAVRDRSGTYTGYAIQSMLEDYGCWAEMANETYVVVIFGLGTTEEDVAALLHAFRQISASRPQIQEAQIQTLQLMDDIADIGSDRFTEPVPFGLHLARGQASEAIALKEAEGRIAAEMVTPYPPGIPLVYAGERLTKNTIARLERLAELGAKCQGAADPSLRTIRVW